MRTFFLSIFVLTALDVLLSAPASRVSTVLNRPSHWLAAWMDPTVPLVAPGHLDSAGAGSAGQVSGPPFKVPKITIPTIPIPSSPPPSSSSPNPPPKQHGPNPAAAAGAVVMMRPAG